MFFLDYWENNLDENGRINLVRFLERNPDLQDEFLEFKEINDLTLVPEEGIGFGDKDVLKQSQIAQYGSIDENNFENHMIAHFEGDHSLNEQKEFDAFIRKNPHLERDLELYKSTFLVVDKGIAFANKPQLKKSRLIAFRTNYFYYSAAVAAIFLMAFLIFNPTSRVDVGMNELSAIAETKLGSPDKALGIEKDFIASDVELDKLDLPGIPTGVLAENIESKDALLHEKSAATDVPGVKETLVRNPFQTNIDHLNYTVEVSEIEQQEITLAHIQARTEMSEVFDDLLLRDAMLSQKSGRETKSTLARIFDNLGKQLFAARLISDESLLADMAQQGKERFTELVEQSPALSTSTQNGKKETYFSLSDNISIRISKAENTGKPKE